MNIKISKKIIIICSAIIVVAIAIIVSILLMLNSKNDSNESTVEYNEKYVVNANNKKRPEKKESELVKENEYNTFTIQAVTEEALLNKYIEDYKYNAINHVEDAYNSLDKEYREKRFGNLEEYKKYLNNISEVMKNMRLCKYQINKYDTYEQYVCLDQYENYYIFNKLPNMSYKVILDTYTIDLPQFIEKYNSSKNENKVAMNAEKIENAINNKDFEYVYNKLDETFKQNNYPSLEKFEEYIKNNLFEHNQFNYMEAVKKSEVYAISFVVQNATEDSEKKVTGTIIMQLKEGTDFVMSFSLK